MTERAGFRAWTPADLPLALTLWGDPVVTRFIDVRGQLNESQVQERLVKEIATRPAYGVQYWPVFRLDTKEFLGCCGLRPYQPEQLVYELGCHLCTAHWGKGYATELSRAVIGYAFAELELSALFAGHDPNNQSSRHVLEKLGFQYTHEEYYPPTCSNHPSYLLTRERSKAMGKG
jgi:RimJ/RimL family protein N-acetyltransferase